MDDNDFFLLSLLWFVNLALVEFLVNVLKVQRLLHRKCFFVDEVLICIEASDGEDESVRANEFGLKLIKVLCRLERKERKAEDMNMKEMIRKMMVIIVKYQ